MSRSAAAYQKFTEDEIRKATAWIFCPWPVAMDMSRKRQAAKLST